LLAERGAEVDRVTVYRWVQQFTPLFADAARPLRHATGLHLESASLHAVLMSPRQAQDPLPDRHFHQPHAAEPTKIMKSRG
jgi:hypothetical protein